MSFIKSRRSNCEEEVNVIDFLDSITDPKFFEDHGFKSIGFVDWIREVSGDLILNNMELLSKHSISIYCALVGKPRNDSSIVSVGGFVSPENYKKAERLIKRGNKKINKNDPDYLTILDFLDSYAR